MKADIQVDNHGTVFLFTPLSKRGKAWLKENTQSEDYQWLHDSLVVEHRHAPDIARGAQRDGLEVI